MNSLFRNIPHQAMEGLMRIEASQIAKDAAKSALETNDYVRAEIDASEQMRGQIIIAVAIENGLAAIAQAILYAADKTRSLTDA